jgi:proline dehydrogenase
MRRPRAALRDLRYALPEQLERVLPGPGPGRAARACRRLGRRGLAATAGYFHATHASPDDVFAANAAAAGLLGNARGQAYLSVKAPALAFDAVRLRRLADRVPLLLDAHAATDAEPTLAPVEDMLPDFPGTGFALPARWRRSAADAARFRDGTARIRLVKGEWADPLGGGSDVAADYLGLVSILAGRSAPVAIATHDPFLAEAALARLLDAGTPCELEQLSGLPRRRTSEVARRFGVRVRVYVPFGPGWWPYALDRALARPYLLSWMLKDRLAAAPRPDGGAERPAGSQAA